MSEVKVNKISPRTNCGTVTVGDSGDSVSVSAGVPVTVNGDLKSNALKATDGGSIISQCGTTITLGASGDTINLAAGASQSGFGRTGTVDWDTTAKTASFTAVSGNGYFVNTTSGAVTVTLPAGSAGDIVSLADYAGTWQTNNVTIIPNGTDKIGGLNASVSLDTEGQSITLVFVDSTQGWITTADSTENITGSPFIVATGGTITCCGNYKIHTFTGPGTFTVTNAGAPGGSTRLDYMVVAGGGGSATLIEATGGGGGGGFRESVPSPAAWTASPLATTTGVTAAVQSYPIQVGGGGAAGAAQPGCVPACTTNEGGDGTSSIALGITSTGGGGGGRFKGAGRPGGSGGGGGGRNTAAGGSGNTPPVSPAQGTNGGNSRADDAPSANDAGGGGGGATGTGNPGGTVPAPAGGNGGGGATTSISGSPVTRAGGGGGGGQDAPVGTGGPGGGGNADSNGAVNTGGGAGGRNQPPGTNYEAGKSGGSGIVIIRYKFQ